MTCRDNAMIMDLCPTELNVPKIREQDGKKLEIVVYAQIFHPHFITRYWLTEYDPVTGDGYGLVDDGDGAYWGYFPLKDMQNHGRDERCKGSLLFSDLPYEVDDYFEPQTLEDLFFENYQFRHSYYDACKFMMTDTQKYKIKQLIEQDRKFDDELNDSGQEDIDIASLLPDFL